MEAARIRLPERDIFADRERYLHYEVSLDGETVDEGNRLMTAPKQFHFRNPDLQAAVGEKDGVRCVTVRSEAFARRIAIDFNDIDVILSDNYFDLQPGEEKTVIVEEIRSGECPSVEALQKNIRVYSNIDIR